MAVPISNFVDVTISTQVSVPTRAGFGTPLIFGFHNKFAERVRSVSSITDLEGLGFDAEDPEHKLLTAIFSQDPRPPTALIGRSTLTPTYTVNVVPVAQNTTIYKVAVDGADAQFTSDASATVAEITAGLKDAIDYLGKDVIVTDNTTSIDIVPRAALISGGTQTFAFTDGDTLLLSVDGAANQTATFNTADFGDISNATAAEIVTVLNTDWTGATASAVTDPDTGKIKVHIQHDSAGFHTPNRSLKITDGVGTPNADSLLFPTTLTETQSAFVFQNKTRRLADSGGVSLLQANDTTADPGDLGADLTAIQGENDTWYAVIPTMGSKAILANGSSDLASAVASAGDKLLLAATMDHNVITDATDNLGEELFDNTRDRAALVWHSKPLSYPDGAWAGLQLPKDPGSTTWMFKSLSGIAADDFLSAEITNLKANNVARYVTVAGLSFMEEGLTSKSQFYIDIRRFSDFLKARLQEALMTRLTQLEKIPFTDAGIAVAVNEIRAVLQEGVRVGGLAADPEPVITAPRASSVSAANKANRILPDIKFTATLAGAIHKFVINGTVTV